MTRSHTGNGLDDKEKVRSTNPFHERHEHSPRPGKSFALNGFQNHFPINMLRRLTDKEASVWAIIVFVLTLVFSYEMYGYPITLAGLLVVILLSVFVEDSKSTLIAASLSIAITLVLYWYSGTKLSEHLFIIFLILLTTIMVLYMKRLNKQLNFEKTHMTALFENATEGIVLTDQDGNIILANGASERMFGYQAKELIGRPVEILLPKSISHQHAALRNTFYTKPDHRSMGSGRDLYAQKKSGEKFSVEVSLSYYYKGDHRYVIAFIVDITHRKQIEESMRLQQQQVAQVSSEIKELNAELEMKVEERTLILKEALQKLEQSQQELSDALDKERELNEIKGRFVSMASHEFRTPLSAVLSSASLLSKYVREEDQEKRDKHIDRIKGAVKNLNEILEDFLSLGKLEEGKVGAINYAFELSAFIEETTEDIKGLLKEGQKIIYDHQGESNINCDKKLLKNVLLNLISNAIKFSEPATMIKISSSVSNGTATIEVTDQGLGISEEDQGHLFSSFFRGANVINIQGSGLGLHIVKRYLDLMNGSIFLKSKLAEGSTFTIIIPTNLTTHE
ncbi:MAG: PAS domain-containing sensor histidine kinase [Ferruginibacter sp.]